MLHSNCCALLQVLLWEKADERVKACYLGGCWTCSLPSLVLVLKALWGLWVGRLDPTVGVGSESQSHRELAEPFYSRVWVTLPPPVSPLQLPQPPVQTSLSLNLAM